MQKYVNLMYTSVFMYFIHLLLLKPTYQTYETLDSLYKIPDGWINCDIELEKYLLLELNLVNVHDHSADSTPH